MTNFIINKYKNQEHPFHLVDTSPWPILTAFSAFSLVTGGTMYMHFYTGGGLVLCLGLFLLITSMSFWWQDVITEATFEGHHTLEVQKGLSYGMILFIVSEICFFFSFFWAFFHASLTPTIQIGAIWPPIGIDVFDPWSVPLLNTIILLSSGVSITWSHKALIVGNDKAFKNGLILTIALGVFFTFLQAIEYLEANFTISDSVYGTTFFVATGFHGLHVLIGTTFIIVCLYRGLQFHFTPAHHFGFVACAWYWHFVDVVWIFLFITIYWWGGR